MLKAISSNVKFYIVANGFYYAGYSVINAFLSLLITTKITGGRIDIVGFVISYYMFVRVFVEIPFSKFTKRYSLLTKRNIIAFSYMLYGVVIFLMGFSTQVWHIFVLQTLTGLLDALSYPLKWGLFTKLVDKGQEELEWGLEDIFGTLLPAIFTALAGVIAVRFGLGAAFLLFAILLVVSGLIFFYIKQRGNLNIEAVLSDNQKHVLKRVVWALKQNNVPFRISGGLAAIIYGSQRPLYDIDIEIYKRDFPKVKKIFHNHIVKDFFHLEDVNFDIYLMTLEIDGVPIDISQAEECYVIDKESKKIRVDADLSRATIINLDGLEIPVANKKELIAYKRIIARDTDLMDVEQIS